MDKSILILVLIGVMIVSYSHNIKSASDSYYKLKLDIGEYNSSIREDMSLDYNWKIKDYDLDLELDLDKKYYFSQGILVEESKWDYDDYLISLNKNNDRLEWGNTSAPFTSTFLSGGNLLGFYLKKNNYQIWHGTVNDSSGFRLKSKEQSGLKWNLGEREVSYLRLKEGKDYNHYLSYSDEYLLNNNIIDVETTLGQDSDEALVGEAIAANLISDFNETNYNLDVNYESADFQAIKSKFNYGHGDYEVTIGGYRPLGFYLLDGEISYFENNLDRKSSSITKEWGTTWKINYYGNIDGIYKLKFDYNIDNNYETEGRSTKSKEDEVNLRFSYDSKAWDYGISLRQNNKEYIKEDIVLNEKSANLFIKYDPNTNYRTTFNYNITRRRNNDLRRDYTFLFNYQIRPYDIFNYNLNLRFEDKYHSRIDLDQSIDYDFSENQKLKLALYLSHYFESDSSLYKKLACEYKYEF